MAMLCETHVNGQITIKTLLSIQLDALDARVCVSVRVWGGCTGNYSQEMFIHVWLGGTRLDSGYI